MIEMRNQKEERQAALHVTFAHTCDSASESLQLTAGQVLDVAISDTVELEVGHNLRQIVDLASTAQDLVHFTLYKFV